MNSNLNNAVFALDVPFLLPICFLCSDLQLLLYVVVAKQLLFKFT